MEKDGGTATIRAELHRIADNLPEGSTWDDVMETIYLEQVIQRGLKASEEGRIKPLEDVEKDLGISS